MRLLPGGIVGSVGGILSYHVVPVMAAPKAVPCVAMASLEGRPITAHCRVFEAVTGVRSRPFVGGLFRVPVGGGASLAGSQPNWLQDATN